MTGDCEGEKQKYKTFHKKIGASTNTQLLIISMQNELVSRTWDILFYHEVGQWIHEDYFPCDSLFYFAIIVQTTKATTIFRSKQRIDLDKYKRKD